MNAQRAESISTITGDTMRPEHPRWGEFMGKLTGPGALNLIAPIGKKTTWTCDGECPPTQAKRILKEMGGISVTDSIEYFMGRGGNCDCEIVWNVDATRQDPREEQEGS